MRGLVMGLLAMALGACAPPVRDVALAGLDLADGKTLASLQQALPQDDRAALGTYALLHWPKSKFYCGQPIGGRAAPAATVGEAIDQTRAYEAALQLAQGNRQTAVALSAGSAEKALITRMEQLVLERDMLRGRLGPEADATVQGKQLAQRLEEMRAELGRLRDAAAP